MDIISVIEEFNTSLNGTDSYVTLGTHMKSLIEVENVNACAYFLILRFCQSYVHNYQDQAVASDFAEKAKYIMTKYLQEIKNDLLNNDGVISVNVLNNISKDYVLENKIF